MKFSFLKYSLIGFTSILLSSCGGGSGGGSSNGSTGTLVGQSAAVAEVSNANTDLSNIDVAAQNIINTGNAAPTTLDATSLQLTSDSELVFHFARLGGNGNAASPETGYANSISTNAGTGVNSYEVPSALRNINYQYVADPGGNTATLIITAEPVVDGIGEIQENPPNPNTDAFDVSIGTGVAEVYYLTFGSDGNVVTDLAVTGVGLPTNTVDLLRDPITNAIITPLQRDPSSPLVTIDYEMNTANGGVNIRRQDGSPLPIGYTLANTVGATRITASSLYPLNLSETGHLDLAFTDAAGVFRDYDLFGATSTNVFAAGNPADQGIYRMELSLNGVTQLANGNQIAVAPVLDANGNVIIAEGDEINQAGVLVQVAPIPDTSYDNDIQYTWTPTPNTPNFATLSITYTDVNLGPVTEQFLFNFASFESGTFNVIQGPNLGQSGIFEFPSRDDTGGL